MPRKKVIKPIEEKIEEPKVEAPKEAKTEFSVYNAQGDFIRTYSVEIHGENAGELAQGFSNKINGKIK